MTNTYVAQRLALRISAPSVAAGALIVWEHRTLGPVLIGLAVLLYLVSAVRVERREVER